MATMVARMTERKLKEMIETTVERKLLELLGDPDAGYVLKPALPKRLLRHKRKVRSAERGEPLAELAQRLGLN